MTTNYANDDLLLSIKVNILFLRSDDEEEEEEDSSRGATGSGVRVVPSCSQRNQLNRTPHPIGRLSPGSATPLNAATSPRCVGGDCRRRSCSSRATSSGDSSPAPERNRCFAADATAEAACFDWDAAAAAASLPNSTNFVTWLVTRITRDRERFSIDDGGGRLPGTYGD